MDRLHTLWAQSLPWMSAPFRICLFTLLALVLLIYAVPPVLRGLGHALEAGSEPVLLALTYPEFVTTSISRRLRVRLLPGTFAYGRLLGGFGAGLRLTGHRIGALGHRKPSFPRRGFLLGAVAVLAVWYSSQVQMPPELQQRVAPIRGQVINADRWLNTGAWTPPAPVVAPACTPEKPAKKPVKKARDPATKARKKA